MSSMRNCYPHRLASLVFLLLAGFALAGCQSSSSDTPSRLSPAQPSNDGYYRSRNPYFLPKPILALESQEMQQLTLASPDRSYEGSGDRWYHSRNDWQLTTSSGYHSATFESTYTQTYDRQYQHGGQVHDYYSKTTRRGSYSQTVR